MKLLTAHNADTALLQYKLVTLKRRSSCDAAANKLWPTRKARKRMQRIAARRINALVAASQ